MDVGATFSVFRCFYVYAFCSCSVKVNERQDMKDRTGRNGLLRPPKRCESESPGVAEGAGWYTTS